MPDPFNNPFARLQGARDALPRAPEIPKRSESKSGSKGPARAIVRIERKGRGGKEVTVVERLGVPAKELAVWLQALKQSLGCGGTVDGVNLVLQGDQRDRLPALLEDRGVRKVTVG